MSGLVLTSLSSLFIVHGPLEQLAALIYSGFGGRDRIRTGVQGFAVLCVATPPPGQFVSVVRKPVCFINAGLPGQGVAAVPDSVGLSWTLAKSPLNSSWQLYLSLGISIYRQRLRKALNLVIWVDVEILW